MSTLRIKAVALCLVSLAMFGGKARADEIKVGLHLASVHLPAKPGQNNRNEGLYIKADSWVVGSYHNTINRQTTYAAFVQPVLGAELMVGLAHGYQRKSGRGFSRGAITPMADLSYVIPVKVCGVSPRLWLIPPAPKSSGVLHFSLEASL